MRVKMHSFLIEVACAVVGVGLPYAGRWQYCNCVVATVVESWSGAVFRVRRQQAVPQQRLKSVDRNRWRQQIPLNVGTAVTGQQFQLFRLLYANGDDTQIEAFAELADTPGKAGGLGVVE